MPHEIFSSVLHKFFPSLERRIKRTVTIPVSQTLTSHHLEGAQQATRSRPVNYITFNAMVGRNSTFRDLASEQIEELCGIEFKALNCLVWIVPCVCFLHRPSSLLLNLHCFIVLPNTPAFLVCSHHTIHVSSTVETILCPPQSPFKSFTSVVRVSLLLRESYLILLSRFSLFQVVSAFTNSGFSLVDQSMVPFQQAYPMVIGLVFLIIAGNTGYVSSSVGICSAS